MSAPATSMFSPQAAEIAGKLGLKAGRANLEEFGATLLELAKSDRRIVAVTSDSRGSGKLVAFGQALPGQLIEVGIAEQNLVGITVGLVAGGKKAFGVSPACFLTARSLEQLKNDICYSDVPAVLVGISLIDYRFYRVYAYHLFALAVALLVIVLLIGRGGADDDYGRNADAAFGRAGHAAPV